MFDQNDIRFHTYPAELLQMKLERSQQFKFLENNNRTASQVALSYILSREEISTCVPGVKSTEQLMSNVGASQIKFTDDELKRVEEIQQNWHEGISRTG